MAAGKGGHHSVKRGHDRHVDSLTSALGAVDDDPLGTFPLHSSEIRVGYARVSTGGQKLDRQLDALTLAGCWRIFKNVKSGKNDARPELKACHAFLQAGDTLTPGGRLIFHVFAALAEFIREPIVQGTNEGLAAARARGRVGGRPSVVNDKLLRAARDMLPNPENSIETIAAPARRLRSRRRNPGGGVCVSADITTTCPDTDVHVSVRCVRTQGGGRLAATVRGQCPRRSGRARTCPSAGIQARAEGRPGTRSGGFPPWAEVPVRLGP